jgi:hypothetical protein
MDSAVLFIDTNDYRMKILCTQLLHCEVKYRGMLDD